VASSEARLPLMLALETREGARRQALEAAGIAPAQGARADPAKEPEDSVAWVPGLPFEAPRRPAARKPGRSGRARR
jgi:hypothetical protein